MENQCAGTEIEISLGQPKYYRDTLSIYNIIEYSQKKRKRDNHCLHSKSETFKMKIELRKCI